MLAGGWLVVAWAVRRRVKWRGVHHHELALQAGNHFCSVPGQVDGAPKGQPWSCWVLGFPLFEEERFGSGASPGKGGSGPVA